MASDQITIRLPDGSTRGVAAGTTAGDLATEIGRNLRKAAVIADVNGIERDLVLAARGRRRGRDHHRSRRTRSVHDPPFDGARARAGRARPVPRCDVRHRAAHRGRLLLRLRAARRQALPRGRPAAHRGPHARDHAGAAAFHPRRAVAPTRPAGCSRTTSTSSRSSTTRRRIRCRPRSPGSCARTRTRRGSSTCAAVPTSSTRARISDTSSSCVSPARTGAATRRSRSCSASTARLGRRRPISTRT